MFAKGRQLGLLSALAIAVVTVSVCPASAVEGLTRKQEQSALRFARQHHPELAELLKQLNQEMTEEYEKAIRQIHLVNERLERMKERSPEEYQLQLDLWKVESRIQLLAARMTMSSDEQLQIDMEKLLKERFTLKEQQLKRDRERTQTRLEKIDAQLESLEKNRDELLQRELARYQKLQTEATSPTSTRGRTPNRKPNPDPPTNSEKKPRPE